MYLEEFSSALVLIVQMPVGLKGSFLAAISETYKPCRIILKLLLLPAAHKV